MEFGRFCRSCSKAHTTPRFCNSEQESEYPRTGSVRTAQNMFDFLIACEFGVSNFVGKQKLIDCCNVVLSNLSNTFKYIHMLKPVSFPGLLSHLPAGFHPGCSSIDPHSQDNLCSGEKTVRLCPGGHLLWLAF